MQNLGCSASRSNAARAFLAGAALLAGAAAPAASSPIGYDEVALALSHVQSHGSLGLAQPLPPSEAYRIRRIFAHHARGDIQSAMDETDEMESPLLLGYVLADRYLSLSQSDEPASADELRPWLQRFPDLADASAIHALLTKLPPKGTALPTLPASPKLPGSISLSGDVDPVLQIVPRNPVLDRSVHEPARAGEANRAVRLIARTRGLEPLYGALLRAEVAQILFTQGRDSQALSLAEAAHHQAAGRIGLAPYVAGLAAWRLGRIETARSHFEAAYAASQASMGQRSAAAFWAARTHLRRGNASGHAPWMRRAAENPRTFYGLLARRALGQSASTPETTAAWTLGEADVEAVNATPAGQRALALLQVGQPERAAAELRRLWAEMNDKPGYSRAIMLVARTAGLQELTAQVASVIETTGRPTMRLPAARLRPRGGFRVDPALVYAVTRQESNFDVDAISPAGARGLMQLMPTTVDFVLGDTAPSPARNQQLLDPATNLELGQRYMVQLSRFDSIQSDLIRLLASYNAGPTTTARWSAELRHLNDPLLFIESIPVEETRAYVPRVLAYSWLYAAHLRLPSPSLDELAAGAWPRFYSGAPRTNAVAHLH